MTSLFATLKQETIVPKLLAYEAVGNCCGIGWICNFPSPSAVYPVDAKGRILYDKTPEMKLRDGYLEQVKSDINLLDKKRYSINLIALNDKQKEYYDDLLKEMGYKPIVKDKYHAWAGNLLTVYSKTRYKKDKAGGYVDTCTDKEGHPEDFLEEDYDYDE